MLTEREKGLVQRANDSGRTPVVFIHGLWLLPSSWDRWAELFEHAGYASLTPGWPDDPDTVEEAKEHPEVFAGKSIGQVAGLSPHSPSQIMSPHLHGPPQSEGQVSAFSPH